MVSSSTNATTTAAMFFSSASSSSSSSITSISSSSLSSSSSSSSVSFQAQANTSDTQLASLFSSSLSLSTSPSSSEKVQDYEIISWNDYQFFQVKESAPINKLFNYLGIDPNKKLIKQSFQLHEFMRKHATLAEQRENFLHEGFKVTIKFKGKTYAQGVVNMTTFMGSNDPHINLAWIKMNLDIDLFKYCHPKAKTNIIFMINSILEKLGAKKEVSLHYQQSGSVHQAALVYDQMLLGMASAETREETVEEACLKAASYLSQSFDKNFNQSEEQKT